METAFPTNYLDSDAHATFYFGKFKYRIRTARNKIHPLNCVKTAIWSSRDSQVAKKYQKITGICIQIIEFSVKL